MKIIKLVATLLLISTCIFCNQNVKKQDIIIKHLEVYANKSDYCAWPSMTRANNGDLLVTFCLTEEHLGPDGALVLMRSKDNGETWDGPETVYNSIIDDRQGGITLLNDGTLICHLWSTHFTKKKYEDLPPNSYGKPLLEKWITHVSADDYKEAGNLHGASVSTSTDDGYTWSGIREGKESIHGSIQLQDGSLLVASYREEKGNIALYKANSSEENWELVTTYKCPEQDTVRFGEPNILQLPSGRIIMMVRATAVPYDDLSKRNHLWETYSDDNGKTWIEMYKTELLGFPPHLLLLSDQRVVCAYGYRHPPFGQRACISEDGITWKIEDEIILRDDAFNKDLGYPASVELEPGKVLTIYYQPDPKDGDQQMSPPDPNRSRPDILGTIWKVPSRK